MAKKFEETADQIEEWYGTKYSVKKIPSDAIEVIVLIFLILAVDRRVE